MKEHAVVIVGGGPTGMMLAGELALAGVDVAIVERRPNQELAGSRAGGLSSRTLEIFDQRGIVDRFLAEGKIAQVAGFAVTRLDISDFPTRHNYGLGLRQKHIERIMAGWVSELAVPIYRSRELTCFAQDETGVTIELSEGRRCGQAISLGAMEAVVWSAKLPALSFEDGMRRPAAFSPRPRWRRNHHWGSIAQHLVSMPSAGRSTRFATARSSLPVKDP
jgi:2-polyprenyl-6-methoxyphenol hydroxylase-like FAD-dependent oxidoreductase